MRALLVNQAEIPQICLDTFPEEFVEQYKNNNQTKKRELIRDIVGYGKVNEDNLYRSTENAVILIAEDTIENDKCQFFDYRCLLIFYEVKEQNENYMYP
ncbi:hypothetical protein Lste_2919 [Legionella steelei]|uniref:Uncharacterized protein n=1 Tax=Legionella steelei TaxID=947033 RepID=A0A0W0ZCE1_9GAMM|nr:hypothetical protein [Legionella steelei]KTD66713.1 hypothetical protein Lste_2919 [Legionella steelei]